jgi:hypothetical protein
MGLFDTIRKVAIERWDNHQRRNQRDMEIAADFLESIADGLKGMAECLREGKRPIDRCEELKQHLLFLDAELSRAGIPRDTYGELGDAEHDELLKNNFALQLLENLGGANGGPMLALRMFEDEEEWGELRSEIRSHHHRDMCGYIDVIWQISGWNRAKAQQLRFQS